MNQSKDQLNLHDIYPRRGINYTYRINNIESNEI